MCITFGPFLLFLRILGEGGTQVIVQIREGRISFLFSCGAL